MGRGVILCRPRFLWPSTRGQASAGQPEVLGPYTQLSDSSKLKAKLGLGLGLSTIPGFGGSQGGLWHAQNLLNPELWAGKASAHMQG